MNAAARGCGKVVGLGCLSVVGLFGLMLVIGMIQVALGIYPRPQPQQRAPAPVPKPRVVERAYLHDYYCGQIDVARSADIFDEYQRQSGHWNKTAMWQMRRDGRVFLIESCPPVEVDVINRTDLATEVRILSGSWHVGETGFVDSKLVTHEKPKDR